MQPKTGPTESAAEYVEDRIEGRAADGSSDCRSHSSSNWLDTLYPIWQWLVLVPVVVLATVLAALVVIVMSLLGYRRAANTRVAASWARLIAWLTPMRVELEGSERLDPEQSYVVVANHRSQYDIPLIYGFCGLDLRWVMKSEIGRVPFVAQGCRAIGHIFINRGRPDQARAAINEAVACLPVGTGVLFFAEGTRSRSGELMAFRKGAFRAAVDRNLPILPMTVSGTRSILPPGSLRVRPGRGRLVIHEPIWPQALPHDDAVSDLCLRTRRTIAAELETRPARPDGAG
ncbi:MAG: 1-acyl-sn-glycerol-3-phosphate acyltransferase [Xanthomonadaceae bacterium]|nr:1-acyl-sn-glycerol-3-phosphate acyltransferase [Xanthomonadaceae bacterium]